MSAATRTVAASGSAYQQHRHCARQSGDAPEKEKADGVAAEPGKIGKRSADVIEVDGIYLGKKQNT